MADPRERMNDMDEALKVVVDRHLWGTWTALPCVVVEDSDGHICRLQPTIKDWKKQEDGSSKPEQMPELGMVPIVYASGGGFTLTHPVKKGDEGIAVFSARCIDGWWRDGGVQPEPYKRNHSLSDAMFIPGVRSLPRKLNPYVAKDATQFRSDDQHHYVEITPDRIRIVVASDKQAATRAEEKDKEKTTTPRMVLEVYADKIRGTVLDTQGKELSWFEHTSDGAFNGKAPQGVTWEAPFIRCTGDVIAKYDSGKITLTGHSHPQDPDSRGDSEKDTKPPKPGF